MQENNVIHFFNRTPKRRPSTEKNLVISELEETSRRIKRNRHGTMPPPLPPHPQVTGCDRYNRRECMLYLAGGGEGICVTVSTGHRCVGGGGGGVTAMVITPEVKQNTRSKKKNTLQKQL